ncbi:cobalt/nickel transport protein [Halogranum amylolyticum]|uniref:Cobalt/nickel transport protein n=1 Tax=Halogranum amylolyticum TaxID=660520 RepID=A0A1H8W2U6_9EURY|nr:PDGLE domain-containing protein [Halogranum amylolyticum]SEP21914.1 cobalt/nickel transport protein [Halogranum amylolyticum]
MSGYDDGLLGRPWMRRALAFVFVLVVLAPAFGWAAGAVDYAEPLENAAEATGAAEHAETLNAGVLPDYTVPGANPLLGTFVAGLVGTALTLGVTLGLGRVLDG